jgi:hypothetical protein
MSAHDDVFADLANRPGLTRPQMEQVVKLLNRKMFPDSGIAITVALRSLLPDAGKRLASASATERAEYLRALKVAVQVTLHRERPAWAGVSG